MNAGQGVFSLFILLFVCVFDGYSMMNYRVPTKRAYVYFAGVTVFCLAVNSYIALAFGMLVLRNVILFTIGIPYFLLILAITKDRISQTVFNFWLWINVYDIIANFSAFVNDYTVRNAWFLTGFRVLLFVLYFVLYNRFLKKKHRLLMEKLEVNWWIFSFIPLCFTVLICLVNYYFRDFRGLTRNYPVLFAIYALMTVVYVLIFYTFKTAYDSMQREKLAQSMKDQIALQKEQYEYYKRRSEDERIFRHDARHRDMALLGYLESGNISGAKELIKREMADLKEVSDVRLCENRLVDAVLAEYRAKARAKGVAFSVGAGLPESLACDEAEFCVMLSNLLENSLDAAKSYISVEMRMLNSQISLNIKNDYSGSLLPEADGLYATTKKQGSGLGLKSVLAILEKHGGFLKIDDKDGIFNVFATLKNEYPDNLKTFKAQ